MTKGYVNNLYNKSKLWTNCIDELGLFMIVCQLPNKIVIVKTGGSYKYCEEEIKTQIADYESYLEYDKKHYKYDLDDEYTMEYGSGGELHG